MYFKVPFIRNEYDAYVSKKKGGGQKKYRFSNLYPLIFKYCYHKKYQKYVMYFPHHFHIFIIKRLNVLKQFLQLLEHCKKNIFSKDVPYQTYKRRTKKIVRSVALHFEF